MAQAAGPRREAPDIEGRDNEEAVNVELWEPIVERPAVSAFGVSRASSGHMMVRGRPRVRERRPWGGAGASAGRRARVRVRRARGG